MSKYPSHLLTLIAFLKKLPGVGSRTAERFAFHLLNWPESHLHDFAALLGTLKEKLPQCPQCQCLMNENGCAFCDLSKRETRLICLISSPRDVYAVEETGAYRGLYHVLGGLLSPLDGRSPEHLHLGGLKARIEQLQIQEAIIALDATLQGDATALYLKELLTAWGVRVSRLALGLPMGSALDYVDESTLTRAFVGRQEF